MSDAVLVGDATELWERFAEDDAIKFITDGHSRSEKDFFASGIVTAGAAVAELRAATGSWDFLNGRILDLGCALGRHCLHFSNVFRGGVVGIDISPTMIELAKKKNRDGRNEIFFLHAKEENAVSLLDNNVDVVFSFTVLQHNPRENVRALAKEMARVLKPGGVTCIQLPVYSDTKRQTFQKSASHTAIWTPEEFREAFSESFEEVQLAIDRHFGFHIWRVKK